MVTVRCIRCTQASWLQDLYSRLLSDVADKGALEKNDIEKLAHHIKTQLFTHHSAVSNATSLPTKVSDLKLSQSKAACDVTTTPESALAESPALLEEESSKHVNATELQLPISDHSRAYLANPIELNPRKKSFSKAPQSSQGSKLPTDQKSVIAVTGRPAKAASLSLAADTVPNVAVSSQVGGQNCALKPTSQSRLPRLPASGVDHAKPCANATITHVTYPVRQQFPLVTVRTIKRTDRPVTPALGASREKASQHSPLRSNKHPLEVPPKQPTAPNEIAAKRAKQDPSASSSSLFSNDKRKLSGGAIYRKK